MLRETCEEDGVLGTGVLNLLQLGSCLLQELEERVKEMVVN